MEKKITSADGTELSARSSGSGSSMVLVHGALSDINTFALVEERLSQRHTIWVYSRRGRGDSGDNPSYSIDKEIDDVLAVVDAAGGDVHLLGHSSGAYYCLLAANRMPNLRSLILYEPPLNVDQVDANILEAAESALRADDPDRALEVFFPVADLSSEEIQSVRDQQPVWETLRQGVRVFPREHRASSS